MRIIIGTVLLLAACTIPAVGAAEQSASESGITPAALDALREALSTLDWERIAELANGSAVE